MKGLSLPISNALASLAPGHTIPDTSIHQEPFVVTKMLTGKVMNFGFKESGVTETNDVLSQGWLKLYLTLHLQRFLFVITIYPNISFFIFRMFLIYALLII